MKSILGFLLLVFVFSGCVGNNGNSPLPEPARSGSDRLSHVEWIEVNPPENSHYDRCWVWFYTVNPANNNARGYSGTECE